MADQSGIAQLFPLVMELVDLAINCLHLALMSLRALIALLRWQNLGQLQNTCLDDGNGLLIA